MYKFRKSEEKNETHAVVFNGILSPKIVLTYYKKKSFYCSRKTQIENSQIFQRSLEQFIKTVKGRYMEKLLGFRNLQKKLEKVFLDRPHFCFSHTIQPNFRQVFKKFPPLKHNQIKIEQVHYHWGEQVRDRNVL